MSWRAVLGWAAAVAGAARLLSAAPPARAQGRLSISENPIFTFAFRATEPGPLKVTFLDTHGGRYEATADVRFG